MEIWYTKPYDINTAALMKSYSEAKPEGGAKNETGNQATAASRKQAGDQIQAEERMVAASTTNGAGGVYENALKPAELMA